MLAEAWRKLFVLSLRHFWESEIISAQMKSFKHHGETQCRCSRQRTAGISQRVRQLGPRPRRPPRPPRPSPPAGRSVGGAGPLRTFETRRAAPWPQSCRGPRFSLSCWRSWASPPPLSRVSCPFAEPPSRPGSPDPKRTLSPLPSGDSAVPPLLCVAPGAGGCIPTRPLPFTCAPTPCIPVGPGVWSAPTLLPFLWVPKERPGKMGCRASESTLSLPPHPHPQRTHG